MMSTVRYGFFLVSCLLVANFGHAASAKSDAVYKDIEFTRLSDRVWMHTSYKTVGKWGRVPANGLIVLGEERVTLVDTAWDNEQTEFILEWTQNKLKRDITHAVFTHAHSDKMGGVAALHKHNVQTWASALSNKLAPSHDLEPAKFELAFNAQNLSEDLSPFVVLYPGAGHTHDNIVVYLPAEKIIYGGCLIRPGNSISLGNTRDGDVLAWANTVETVADNFPDAKQVIPTHGAPGSRKLLSHTIDLAHKHNQKITETK
ncbi:subclass B1 metallo-beta-lactamase [Pseudoteredinibacter isoporae]|uniref:beta-lactamase n=1 Tax=Pseudoteredinibacter isoporae TaxID=570281 RepID=A0A7X0JY17_9GAMM|nr:subclass B1 metallo-beta-lactamase [Pseudoteredinibacter isoporae]MBB6523829.1 glyoxylase-like metal-dependent hydrolase (beta-lactamase superfamily II) [Pseudoteredinibacter isoporae]NHO89349.1 subclass B1 metallo-beta-lactamase [Pseudoteredinibacter isoporae]NIB22456.1 subclass B1 metallo-beta-lactamase [Pseudoteredinibacter isoporae]